MNAFRVRFCLLLALVLTSASAAATPPKPLLWKVSDGDNHVYLLGSFHALKPTDYPVAPSVEAAFADSETVSFEISPAEMESPELPMKMLTAAMLPPGQTLQQSLTGPDWARLQRYAQRRNMSLDNYQSLEPWFLSLVISLQEMALIGYDPKQGLDQYLIARSVKAGKHTRGLETADEQIAALDSMTMAEQRQSLAESLDEAEDFKTRMDDLHDHWRAGDDKTLEALMATEFKRDYAQLYQHIDVARNQAWLPKIRKMLDDEHGTDTLIVVGCLHLLGSDGLVSQLKARGYRVERL